MSIFPLLVITTFRFGEIYLVLISLHEYLFRFCFQAPFLCVESISEAGPHSPRKGCPPCLCLPVSLPLKWKEPGLGSMIQVSLEKTRGISPAVCFLPHQPWSPYLECDPLGMAVGTRPCFPRLYLSLSPPHKIKITAISLQTDVYKGLGPIKTAPNTVFY